MTPEQEARLKKVEDMLALIVNTDRYVFQKHIQILDARNIQLGLTTGTKIGTAATQKLGFYGKTPVIQAGAITTPNSQGSTYNLNDITTLKTAIDAIRTALINIGITA